MVHQFLTGREAGGIKPIFGLTAYVLTPAQTRSRTNANGFNICRGMMIRVATIGYGREPEFEVMTSETPSLDERIAWALLSRSVFRRACEKEGVDLTLPMKLCGVTGAEFEALKKDQDGEGDGERNGKERQKTSGEARRRNWLRVWRAKL